MCRRLLLVMLIALLPATGAAAESAPETAPSARDLLSKSRPSPALSQAAEALTRDPASAPAWSMLAGMLFRNGDFEGAEQAARRALLLDPHGVDAMVVLARCLDTTGDFGGTREQLKKAVELAPEHPVALRLLAGRMDLNSERDAACALMRRFVESKPADQALFIEHAQRMLALFGALGPLEIAKLPPWAERPERVELPMRLDGQGLSIEIQVGTEKRRFCFDTGEESVTVRAETAKALGFKALAELPAVTAAGVGRMPVVLAPRLEAGAFRVENVLLSLGAVDVIGPAFFAGYAVHLDFEHRTMVLTRQKPETAPGPKDLLGAPQGVTRYRFRRLGNLIWVPISCPQAPAALSGKPAWGILDSGCQYPAAVTIRYLEALRSERGRGPLALPFRAEIGGAAAQKSREMLFYALKDFTLEFLGSRLSADGSAATASFGDISKVTEAEVDLLIGWPLIHRSFKSMELDFQRCVLTVEPRAVPLP